MASGKKILLLGLCVAFFFTQSRAEGEDLMMVQATSGDDYPASQNIQYYREHGDKSSISLSAPLSELDNPEITRLKSLIDKAREDKDLKAEADALLAITRLYMSEGYPTGPGLISLQQYHKVMESMADEIGLAVAYRNSGVVFFSEGDYERAMDYYLKAVEIFEKLNNQKESANMYYNIGLLFSRLGNERNAQAYYLKCLKEREHAGDLEGKASVFKALALLHRRAGNIDISLSYYDKLIAVCRALDNPQKLAAAYNNKGVALKESGRYAEAATFYHLALNQLRESGVIMEENSLAASVHENLGILLRYDSRPDESMSYYNRALQIRQRLGDERAMAGIYANMGNLMQENGQLDRAIDLYKQCEAIELAMEDRQGLVATYSQLASLYKEAHYIDRALAYQEKYTDLQMTLLQENRNSELVNMQYQYELQKKNREISKLDAENRIRLATLEKERSLRTTWLFGVLTFILLTILSIAVFRHRTEVKKLKVLAGVEG